MKHVKRCLLVLLLCAGFIFHPSDIPGCGPFFSDAVFTNKRMPPLPEYFRGHLGVLQPTFDRKYLFVAYRYLSGQPLTQEESQSLISPSDAVSASQKIWADWGDRPDPEKEWLIARNQISGIEPLQYIGKSRADSGKDTEWRYFLNCSDDAFKTATSTLNARIHSYGMSHPGIKSWVNAQDVVFSNCSKGEAIPTAADTQLPQAFQFDRTYQIAAAHFYAEHYDTAAELFDEIASNANSPWSTIAPYLAVRSMIRKATVPQKYGEFDRKALMEADQRLKNILHDQKRTELHPIAARMTAFVDLRLNSQGRLQLLGKKLARQTTGKEFVQDLIDYQYLMDHIDRRSPVSPDVLGEMTDWIFKFQSSDDAYCVQRWSATKNTTWLLAAITKVHTDNPNASALMDESQKIPKNSPGFATAQYHRIRLMMEVGKGSDARNLLDELLPTFRSGLPKSSLNLFLSQRMQLAGSFEEFLEFAPRVPQGIDSGFGYSEQTENGNAPVPLLDTDSVKILNRAVPLKFLARAATSRLLLNMRKEILRAAWTRAVMISDDKTASNLAEEMAKVFPELQTDLKAWQAAEDSESKKFAAAWLMLHFPGMNPFLYSGVQRRDKISGIDNYRENWWCGFDAGNLDSPDWSRYNMYGRGENVKIPQPASFPSFMNDSDKAAFSAEWTRMAVVPTAPTFFGKIVIPWARKHPADDRVPEALHLVVKSTRFGCPDKESGTYSQAAFQLLHSKYPNSPWTQETPHWFK
jgi:hypothetical protein